MDASVTAFIGMGFALPGGRLKSRARQGCTAVTHPMHAQRKS